MAAGSVPSSISEPTAAFLRERLGSIEQVEIVLLLRSRADLWTAEAVAKELATALPSATMRLFLLTSNGILSMEGGTPPRYRYVPDGGGLQAMIDEVAAVYAERPLEVARILEAPAADPAKTFADAFRLRRKE